MTMNAYEKEALIKRASQQQLIAVMQGQSDAFPQWMALAELNNRREMGVANDGMKAQQQLAQGKQTVKDRKMAEMLPEMQGIGQLPAPNMGELAAAHGGIMSYADGGEVAHFDGGGSAFSRWWERVNAGSPEYVQRENERASLGPTGGFLGLFADQSDEEYEAAKKKRNALAGITTPPAAAPAAAPATAPAAAPDAASANIKKKLNEAPERVKDALKTTAQPAVPVPNPTETQKNTMQDRIDKSKLLEDYMEKKFGAALDPIKDQLAKDREDYKTMKSENVGLALLGAAGSLLKPGRSTASAIGEGLSTLGEYGMKFQPQMLAARQGISAGEVGLAQAQAQAARGNFSTAMQAVQQEEANALKQRELAMQERYYGKLGDYYSARGAAAGAGGGINPKLYAQQYNKAESAWNAHLKTQPLTFKPTEAQKQAWIEKYMQNSLGLTLQGAGAGTTGGPNYVRGTTLPDEDIMGR